jgi:hypothetical protein
VDGSLLLRGRLRKAEWRVHRDEIIMQTETTELVFMGNREVLEANTGDGHTHFLGWARPDALEEEWAEDTDFGITVWCLKLKERTERKGTFCLLLFPTDDTEASFRRIGHFEIGDARYLYNPPIDRDFFDDIELTTINII